MMTAKTIGCYLIAVFMLCLVSCHNPPDAIDGDGNPIYLADYQGKWLIVNYWANWCKPCLIELPELNAFYTQHSNKVMVLGVSFDALPNVEIKQFANKLHITFPLLANFPNEKIGIQEIPSLPITFIINPQGKLVKTLYGPQTKESLLNVTLKNIK